MRFDEPADILNWLPWATYEMLNAGQVHYAVLCTGTTICFEQLLTVNTNELDVVFFSCSLTKAIPHGDDFWTSSTWKRLQGYGARGCMSHEQQGGTGIVNIRLDRVVHIESDSSPTSDND